MIEKQTTKGSNKMSDTTTEIRNINDEVANEFSIALSDYQASMLRAECIMVEKVDRKAYCYHVVSFVPNGEITFSEAKMLVDGILTGMRATKTSITRKR